MEITDVQFETLTERPHPTWIMRVVVHGGDFEEGATPLRAAVGNVPVEAVTHLLDADGITGYLADEPASGDELQVGYIDEELFPTGFTYQPPIA